MQFISTAKHDLLCIDFVEKEFYLLIELFSKLRTLTTVRLGLAATSRYNQRIVMYALEYVFWLIETESTCSSECDSRCNEQAWVSEPLMLRVLATASGVPSAARKLEL